MEATTNTFIRWFNSDEIVPNRGPVVGIPTGAPAKGGTGR